MRTIRGKAIAQFTLCLLLIEGISASPTFAADAASPLPTSKSAAPEPLPYTLSLTYTGEPWYNQGGLKTGFAYMQGVDANLSLDLQRLMGVPNAQVYIEGFYQQGDSLDLKYTGAWQAPSALDTYTNAGVPKLYQLYYDQQFGSTDILFGKYDTQTQFGTTRPMDLFGNRAQSYNAPLALAGILAGLNGGSDYPYTSLGLRIKQTINDQWAVKFGLLSGESDNPDAKATTGVRISDKYGALMIGEVDYTPSSTTKLLAGVWGETGQLVKIGQFTPSFQPVTTWGEVGEYIGGATRVFTISPKGAVDAFFNAGLGPEDTGGVSQSFDAGLNFSGLVPGRPKDKFGLAVFTAKKSDGYLKLVSLGGFKLNSYESGVEATYRARITDWLVLQPEVQYIRNPALSNAKSALDLGLHFEINKTFN